MSKGNEFWLERWEDGIIPFHQETINPDLMMYWPALDISPGATVFVPLCGKSLDMLWLAKQGFHVVGIELSEIAVQEFAKENNLLMRKVIDKQIINYSTDTISIYVADIFGLSDTQLVADAIYDRGALIALPSKLRPRYTQTCLQWLKPQGKILLKTMDYDQRQMEGPPYSVPGEEVRALYSSCQKIQCIKDETRQLIDGDYLSSRGLKQAMDHVWIIEH